VPRNRGGWREGAYVVASTRRIVPPAVRFVEDAVVQQDVGGRRQRLNGEKREVGLGLEVATRRVLHGARENLSPKVRPRHMPVRAIARAPNQHGKPVSFNNEIVGSSRRGSSPAGGSAFRFDGKR
jgi:hypothetical protein